MSEALIKEAVEIVKRGAIDGPKTRENIERANRMGRILTELIGGHVDCGWCARKEVYKHLKKYLEGHGHL